jgi:alpha-glucosidase (family GH31 glycosyl hydrolase)
VDSTWSTGLNNFVWDVKKFPNAKQMIDTLHAKEIKVICWATGMINPDSPNFEYAKQHKYLLNDGKLVKWWHDHGYVILHTT